MTRLTPIAMVVVALIMSFTLVSDRVRVNVAATPHFEPTMQYTHFRVQYENGVPSIYLSGLIKEPDNYRDLIMFIRNLNTPTAKLYLAGHGGNLETTLQLINAMNASKTEIEAVVYGDVYSGHAMLAVSAKKLTVMNNNIEFLFHVPAIVVEGKTMTPKQYCNSLSDTDTDRGISVKKKCLNFEKAANDEFMSIIVPSIKKYLTAEQIVEMLEGNDIILSYSEMLANEVR